MVATRFAVAIHILMLLAMRRGDGLATSQVIAASVNTNPVVVRRIAGRLARAGLLRVRRGPGGAELTRSPACISLGDVWQAMHAGSDGTVLTLHETPNEACPVACRVVPVLSEVFRRVDAAMLAELHRTTLADLLATARGDEQEAGQPVAEGSNPLASAPRGRISA